MGWASVWGGVGWGWAGGAEVRWGGRVVQCGRGSLGGVGSGAGAGFKVLNCLIPGPH